MNDQSELERAIARFLEAEAPQPGRHVLDHALSLVASTRQRRGWAPSLMDQIASVEWMRLGATGAVVAVALVLGITIGRATAPVPRDHRLHLLRLSERAPHRLRAREPKCPSSTPTGRDLICRIRQLTRSAVRHRAP